MPRKNKNLIIGFATNMSEISIKIFCLSARSVYPAEECDVVILTNRDEPYFDQLREAGIRFASTPSTYSRETTRFSKLINRCLFQMLRLGNNAGLLPSAPEIRSGYHTLLETLHHPHFARWYAYARFLALNPHYGMIMAADTKDVMFQAPFFHLDAGPGLAIYQDSTRYGSDQINDGWYRNAYGARALAAVAGEPAHCIGTILSTQDDFVSFLSEFNEFIARSPFGKIEQAIFNYMIYTGRLTTPTRSIENVENAVATLGSQDVRDRTQLVDGFLCRKSDKQIIPIVHMYDRFSDLTEICENRFL